MSGCSTPKRQLEEDEDEARSEADKLDPKRSRIRSPPTVRLQPFRSSSQGFFERRSDSQILNYGTEQMDICSDEAVIEDPRKNCRVLPFDPSSLADACRKACRCCRELGTVSYHRSRASSTSDILVLSLKYPIPQKARTYVSEWCVPVQYPCRC